jgi:hypothetical protein
MATVPKRDLSTLAASFFALIGLINVAIGGTLLAANWPGSVVGLWQHLLANPDSYVLLGEIALIHFTMAALSFRFLTRPPYLRIATILGGLAIFGITLPGLFRATSDWMNGDLDRAIPPVMLIVQIGRTILYGLCSLS